MDKTNFVNVVCGLLENDFDSWQWQQDRSPNWHVRSLEKLLYLEFYNREGKPYNVKITILEKDTKRYGSGDTRPVSSFFVTDKKLVYKLARASIAGRRKDKEAEVHKAMRSWSATVLDPVEIVRARKAKENGE